MQKANAKKPNLLLQLTSQQSQDSKIGSLKNFLEKLSMGKLIRCNYRDLGILRSLSFYESRSIIWLVPPVLLVSVSKNLNIDLHQM